MSILIVDENCSISGKIEDPEKPANPQDAIQDQGIVQGQGNSEEAKPRIQDEVPAQKLEVAVGQFVLNQRPRPLLPARPPPRHRRGSPAPPQRVPTFGLYREATIEPTADLNQLDELFIVLNTNPEAKPPVKKDSDSNSDSAAK